MPGFESLGYEDWARQSKHEFESGLLKCVSYAGMKVQVMLPGRVMFKTTETVEVMDGGIQAHGVEIVIEKEPGGKWRVVQERILSPEKTEHDRILQ